MKNSLLLICGLLISYSCGKDDMPTISAGNFESTDMIKNDPVVLYTKGQVITDTLFIKNFLERNQASTTFDFHAGAVTSPIQVSFNNSVADSAYLTYNSDAGRGEYIFSQVNYKNNTAIFTTRDRLWTPAAEDGELSCTNVHAGIRQYLLPPDCAPAGGIGDWTCHAQYQIPIMMIGNDIAIVVLNYYFSSKSATSYCKSGERYILAQFNEDALKTIHTEDTLVVQTRTLVLEKK
ncbi:hypothetical protein [Chitinophaga sp. S165]|uniref:hypothetical protein n=1 Tax=Chitinophaga sp. S165 TaxID=2135462 RepID=UPI000D711734|nr:hypothetical protein [Chitinophaga sp. S165]PWV47561.1 hypothetical protein C7475_108128 [Chitinophaga sp. S165]